MGCIIISLLSSLSCIAADRYEYCLIRDMLVMTNEPNGPASVPNVLNTHA